MFIFVSTKKVEENGTIKFWGILRKRGNTRRILFRKSTGHPSR